VKVADGTVESVARPGQLVGCALIDGFSLLMMLIALTPKPVKHE
jgi:hypothetical protein